MKVLYFFLFLSVWDILQTDFKCCGVDFPGDWSMTPWSRSRSRSSRRGNELPESCCSALPLHQISSGSSSVAEGGADHGATCTTSSADHFDLGCIDALEYSSRRNACAIGAIACVVGFGQIFLLVAACQLMKGLKRPEACYPCF